MINLVADERLMNSNAANIEKKRFTPFHFLKIRWIRRSAKGPAATVMHEEIHAQDTGKKMVKGIENANL